MSGLNRISHLLLAAAIFIAAVFVPLLVKVRAVRIPDVFVFAGYPNPLIDGFSLNKAICLIILAVIALVAIVLQRRFFKLSDSILLAIAAFVIASAMLSPYRAISLWGVPFIFEGWPSSLAYIVFAMAATRLRAEYMTKLLPLGIALASLPIALFGLMEMKGTQLINTPWLAQLLLELDGRIHLYNGGFASASIPFGNPNYVGLYAAMIWPFLFVVALTRKLLWERLVFLVPTLLAFALLLASLSRGGLIGASISIFFSLLFLGKRRLIKSWLLLAFVLCHGMSYYAMDQFSERKTSDRVATVAPQFALSQLTSASSSAQDESSSKLIEMTKIEIEAGRLKIEGKSPKGRWLLRIERQYRAIKFMDENFRPLAFRVGDGKAEEREKIQIIDPRYEGLNMALRDAGAFRVLSINAIDVAITNWGFRVGRVGAFVTPVVAERFPLPIKDEAFSYRGFIWSHSIPLLKHTIFLGRAAGAFPFDFPNNDPIKMSSVFGPDSLVDKPHNFFISFAHTHGVIAMILFLGVFAYSAWRNLGSFSNSDDGREEIASYLPYLSGVSGYLICGLTADSSIGVSVIFWVMFGVILKSPKIKA